LSSILLPVDVISDEAKEESREVEGELEKEVVGFKNTFIYSLILGLPLLYLSMGRMLGLPQPDISFKVNGLLQFFFTTLIMAVNYPLYISGLKKLISLNPNMDSLVETGTLAAYFYSLVILVLLFLKPASLDASHLYFESAGFILIFISLGKYLEALTKGKTRQSVKKLIDLKPQKARLLKKGKEKMVLASQIKVGDKVLVKPGEKIPVDGEVYKGHSAVDEKMVTGESIPLEKKKGNFVIAGTLNQTGVLYVKTTKVGSKTMLSQIIKVVEEAINSKAPIQLLADKVSFYFVPAVFVIALLTFTVWLLLGQSFVFALTAMVSVLIIACPCSLGLATPTAVVMGTSLAAEQGILIKTSKALEIAKKITLVVFDKTGTLTKGEPEVTDIFAYKKGKKRVLQLAASLEKLSEHPLAKAVLKEAGKRKIKLLGVKKFKALLGRGVKGEIEGKKVLVGTEKLIEKENISFYQAKKRARELERKGKTVLMVGFAGEVVGVIAVADKLKTNAALAVAKLKNMGKKTAMITGDNKRVAQAIAKKVGIKKVLAQVLPQEKSKEVKALQGRYKVAFVGDGINDAPALAQSDLGIALGSGTDIALETGEIILVKDDLLKVVTAIDLSSFTLKKIKQNLFWAFFYNVMGIPIAAGVLYPLTGSLLSPTVAAMAMAFSSVSVVSNSLLMKRYKPR